MEGIIENKIDMEETMDLDLFEKVIAYGAHRYSEVTIEAMWVKLERFCKD